MYLYDSQQLRPEAQGFYKISDLVAGQEDSLHCFHNDPNEPNAVMFKFKFLQFIDPELHSSIVDLHKNCKGKLFRVRLYEN